jgi:tryptophan synthase alpha chain
MSRIDDCFARLKASGEKALVCFVTAGDPDLETTKRVVLAMDKAGADIVELGVPFSDPIADGPSIQAASMRSLEAGTNMPKVLNLVREIRKTTELPLVLMTYYNLVEHYGLARFAKDAAEAGVDGTILSDLIPEEAQGWKAVADAAGLSTIFLLAPTSTEERVRRVADVATGFIYCVSRTGVTGAQASMAQGIDTLVARIREGSDLPIAVGFGISNADHVREVCEYADGAVVGSVFVNLIAEKSQSPNLLNEVSGLVASLKAGTRS